MNRQWDTVYSCIKYYPRMHRPDIVNLKAGMPTIFFFIGAGFRQESLNYYFHSCDLDILGLCLCVCEGDEAAATWLQFISFIWRISYLHVHPDINVGNYGQLHTFVLATQYSVIIIKEKKWMHQYSVLTAFITCSLYFCMHYTPGIICNMLRLASSDFQSLPLLISTHLITVPCSKVDLVLRASDQIHNFAPKK
jgi:hypothetical protein